MEKHFARVRGALTGILFTLFFISAGLILAINFRPLFYADIKLLNLEAESGLSASVIKENYDALIDYCSPFYTGELSFPSLPASESGLSHFAEVKVLFQFFYITGVVTLILLIGIALYERKKKNHEYLLISSITMILLPLICLIGSAIDFNKTFVLFHRLVFSNDDWLFDPVTDPIINILPESFFLQCALIIIFTVLAGSLILFLCYRHYCRLKSKVASSL